MSNSKTDIINSPLSNNIKFFRKKYGFSQDGLAQELGIKRSNIAAYESKNVEPRLKIILELSKLFNVSVRTLIEKTIEDESEIDAPGALGPADINVSTRPLDLSSMDNLNEFIEKSVKIRKVLEGFKSFYNFKREQMLNLDEEDRKLHFDIENFLQLMEHLLNYNESVIKTVQNIQNNGLTDNS
jgi:transcriptional regulator with XRE-family HTH domain